MILPTIIEISRNDYSITQNLRIRAKSTIDQRAMERLYQTQNPNVMNVGPNLIQPNVVND